MMLAHGQPGDRFPTTHWTWIWQADREGEEGRRALGRLLERYMPAMRVHLLQRLRISAQQADDLLQEFVARKILEQHLLVRADRARGCRFRSFLLTALDHFALNELRHAGVERRHRVDMDVEQAPAGPAAGPDPFEAAWMRQAVAAALERMRAECSEKGRLDIWEVFQCRIIHPLLEGDEPIPYERLVQQFGYRAPVQASMVLATGKRMFHRCMRRVVAEYAASEAEADSELGDLLAMLGRGAK